MSKQNFETIKIGVCDCFWRPTPTEVNPTPEEIYLGLTKGGVELIYTPEWHEITVDQFGNSLTESVLIGESVQVNVPLAETDLDKLSMFSHTATKISESETVTGQTQIETTTVSGSITVAGDVEVTITSSDQKEKVILVPVEELDTSDEVAEKIRQVLENDSDITEFFTVSGTHSDITLTKKALEVNDELFNISIKNGDCEGLEEALVSATIRFGKPTVIESREKLTFGRRPGYRLEGLAGRIRVHPIALGNSNEEDIIIYKAVNKAPLQLNYKLDEERIYSTEFVGMIQRKNVNGSMLWEIGDSTIGNESLMLSQTLDMNGLPSNLNEMVKNSGSNIWISVPEHPVYTEDTDPALRTTALKVYCEFSGQVYNITPLVTLTLPEDNGVWFNGTQVVRGTSLPSSSPNIETQNFGSDDFATVSDTNVIIKGWESSIVSLVPYGIKGESDFYPTSFPSSWRLLTFGDTILIKVEAVWDTMKAEAFVRVQIA